MNEPATQESKFNMNPKEMSLKDVIILIFVALDLIAFFIYWIPDGIGKSGVIIEIVKNISAVILWISILLLGAVFVHARLKWSTTLIGIAFVLTGFGLIFYHSSEVDDGFSALKAGPQSMDATSYSLRMSTSSRGPTSYYIILKNETQSVKLMIDKTNYSFISEYSPTIQITYYPYINIVDEISYTAFPSNNTEGD